jgi:hypothetical protein
VGGHLHDVARLALERRKSEFEELLDQQIRESLDLTPSAVGELSYDNAKQKEKCERLLLLLNVETVRRNRNSTERYSFRMHKLRAWSLEHIHAQNAESLTTADQWREWLRLHRSALQEMPMVDGGERDGLVSRMERAEEDLSREGFHALAREVTQAFATVGEEDTGAEYSVHSVANLALLSSGNNSALGNSVFEVKRRRIIELDRAGEYIPICTRNVFLKYYTESAAQQIHFWSIQDRSRYLHAMISPENGVLRNYLKSEDQTA